MTKSKIERFGTVSRLTPYPEDLKAELTFKIGRSVWGKGRYDDFRYESEIQNLYELDGDTIIFQTGFIPRVCRFLKKKGIKVVVEDHTGLDIPPPDFSKLTETPREWQVKAFKIFNNSPGGIFNIGTGGGKTRMIIDICRVYNANIVVTSQKSAILEQVAMALRQAPFLKGEVTVLGTLRNTAGGGKENNRITVCHSRSLLNAPITDCQFLLYDEVHGSVSDKTMEDLAKIPNANMYGFSASPTGRPDQRDPIIEGFFGPIVYTVTHKELIEQGIVSPVEVHMYRCSTDYIPTRYVDKKGIERDLKFATRMKRGYVRNEGRNRFISKVAQKYKDRPIMILCRDDLEHVFRLLKYLPDFTPVYSPASIHSKIGNSKKTRYGQLKGWGLIPEGYKPLGKNGQYWLAKQFREGKITKVITTSCWSTGIDLPNLEVLIRADGDRGEIEGIQSSGRIVRKKKKDAVLVDFYDCFNSLFERRSLDRERHYKNIGYKIRRL